MADLKDLEARIMNEYGVVIGWAKVNLVKALLAAIAVGWVLARVL